MDLISSCKDKLTYFRIKELKDILTQLGLAKQGKKQDLVDRILAVLSVEQVSEMHGWAKKNYIGKEGVAKIIDDAYRKMRVPGASDLSSNGLSASDINNVKLKEEVDDSFQLDMKISCLCGSSLLTESMIQCEDPRCQTRQHIGCVIISEKSMEGVPPQFYCETCRISRADPFWVTVAHQLFPVKLTTSNIPTDGTNPVQNVETTFQLTRQDINLLQKTEYDVQAWCILLNDKVPFRMQWPQYADLKVNGVPVRTFNRLGSQLLGANGRDDGSLITAYTREGINNISLSGCDARIFCFGVRIVKRRTVQQVLNLIPKEPDGEQFEDALARVCRCIGGGTAAENADSDSDLEIVADSVIVNLRCPMSGSRMKTAGRFKPCAHMGCFDLETFVELNQRSRKWQCPICLENYSLESIIIDPYFNRITTMMLYCGEDVTEIDVKPDGSWRAKNENEHRDLAQWHFADGTLFVAADEDVKPNLETTKQIKQEGVSEGHTGLRIGIKKNRNGVWEVSRPEDMHTLLSGNRLQEKFENHDHDFDQKVMLMSSSATGSGRDDEDYSVNQDIGGHFVFSTNNGNELNSVPLNFDPTYGVNRNPCAPSGDADIIVLSDSEEENENLIETVYGSGQDDAGGVTFSVPHPGVIDVYPEDSCFGTGGSSFPGLFNGLRDDYGIPLCPFQSGAQAGSGFQLFGTDMDVSDAFDVQHASVTCPMAMNGYVLTPEATIGSATQIQDSSFCLSHTSMNEGLVDNPLAFGGDDPYLQNFLPTQPAAASVQSDFKDEPDMLKGIRAEDWISLRLGGGCGDSGGGHGESAAANGLNSRNQFASKEASLLMNMKDDRCDRTKTNRQRSDSPFSYPRQRRSVRPRLCLSTGSDSE